MFELELNIYESIGIAVVFLFFGRWLQRRYRWIANLTIPAAIIGGLIFAVFNMLIYQLDIGVFYLDTSLTEFFMVIYFTTIGFNASLKAIGTARKTVLKFLGVSVIAVFLQNFLAIGMSQLFKIDSLLALLLGSPVLVGGPGTAAAIAPTIEQMGHPEAMTVGLTAASLGIVIGSLSAGKVGEHLIKRHHLTAKNTELEEEEALEKINEDTDVLTAERVYKSALLIFFAMFIGSYVTEAINWVMGFFVNGISFPVIIGPMLSASVLRNISDVAEKPFVDVKGISAISPISLDIFLGLTIVSLELWTVFEIAVPMLLIIAAEAVVTILFAYFIVFWVMNKDYDATIMTVGFIGFGMGSSSNGMAAMRTVTRKHHPSPIAFLTVAIVGGLFIDFLNVILIYGFIGGLA